ncbi:MAG: TetR/AcrR family transcriptional regulator [Rhodocyclales bacterium]|nr:TetR/AcrR family transcriptional regulator [Rhodocyclales bacterium]
MKPKPPPSGATARRRPRQSRAWHTSQALQDAYVRLLVERGHAGITIREIVALAGTGLGSFYEYFASKDDLALVCLHLRTKRLLRAMHVAIGQHAGRPLRDIVDAVICAQLTAHDGPPREWGAHYLLERHHSSADAYRKMYDRFVAEWEYALESAADLPASCAKAEVARVCQTIMYGLFAHAFLRGEAPDAAALARQTRAALRAWVDHVAPRSR